MSEMVLKADITGKAVKTVERSRAPQSLPLIRLQGET
jgi:hypothetical protein